jgi:hypothetical protein
LGNSIFSSTFCGADATTFCASSDFLGASFLEAHGESNFGAGTGGACDDGFEIGGEGTDVTDGAFSCCDTAAGAGALCSDGIFELLVGSYLKGFSSSTKNKI